VIDVNLRGTYLSNRAVLPALIEQRRGTILNLSSVSGIRARAHDAAYCASKFAVLGLSESLHAEVRRYGVRVQAILPDVVATPLWEQNGPVPRPADALPPERVADLIVFMLTQPDDTTLVAPMIAPLRARRRKSAPAETGLPEPAMPAAAVRGGDAPERLLDPFESRRPWR
jgi:NAD(P)-dependent dehydrogenase (short-subunit alcohol dehydrogenase family)